MGRLPANSKQNLRCDLKDLISVTAKKIGLSSSFRKNEVNTLYLVSPIEYSYKTQTECMKQQFEDSEIELEQVD